jgi:hypothetical protein
MAGLPRDLPRSFDRASASPDALDFLMKIVICIVRLGGEVIVFYLIIRECGEKFNEHYASQIASHIRSNRNCTLCALYAGPRRQVTASNAGTSP